MKRIALSALIAFALAPVAAQATNINCPLTTVRVEISSSVPSPWWQTPQVGDLTNARVQTIAGAPTLMCGYWAYGTNVYVMRLPPPKQKCVVNVDHNGFVCS